MRLETNELAGSDVESDTLANNSVLRLIYIRLVYIRLIVKSRKLRH